MLGGLGVACGDDAKPDAVLRWTCPEAWVEDALGGCAPPAAASADAPIEGAWPDEDAPADVLPPADFEPDAPRDLRSIRSTSHGASMLKRDMVAQSPPPSQWLCAM